MVLMQVATFWTVRCSIFSISVLLDCHLGTGTHVRRAQWPL